LKDIEAIQLVRIRMREVGVVEDEKGWLEKSGWEMMGEGLVH